MWPFCRKGPSGFNWYSTAEEVTKGIDGSGLTAVVTVISRTLTRSLLKSVQQGAATTCYVALHPQAKGISGEYFSDSNLNEASKKAADVELAKKLWDFSLKAVN